MNNCEPASDIKGVVFNIQRFCVHDGPGIRTTVFLKGCTLRCRWCCNPESQRFTPEVSHNSKRCLGALQCGACLAACKHGAIRAEGNKILRDPARCTQCGDCAAVCPAEAMQMIGKVMSAREVVEEISADFLFYGEEGGFTLSGGEPMAQPDFAAAICTEAHLHGLHAAAETCAAVPWENMRRVCAVLDHLLVDIKHLDPLRHKEGTGAGNDLILDNIKRVAEVFPRLPLTIRCPVIPGFNDDLDSVLSIACFAGTFLPCAKLELLPYHRLGKAKYENLGRAYAMPDIRPPAPELMHSLRLAAGEFIEVL